MDGLNFVAANYCLYFCFLQIIALKTWRIFHSGWCTFHCGQLLSAFFLCRKSRSKQCVQFIVDSVHFTVANCWLMFCFLQKIVFKDWLPVWLGRQHFDPTTDYNYTNGAANPYKGKNFLSCTLPKPSRSKYCQRNKKNNGSVLSTKIHSIRIWFFTYLKNTTQLIQKQIIGLAFYIIF